MDFGEQYVMMTGTSEMLQLYVNNWDILVSYITKKVNYLADIIVESGIPTSRGYFGEGSGPIHLSKAHCGRDDTSLINCSIDKTASNGCDHSQDAGVICRGEYTCPSVISKWQY